MEWELLQKNIVSCESCSRLREWCTSRKGQNIKYNNQDYWSKPVPGFGDWKARLIIIGLAPGAHGANRTGRPFVGDEAGKLLFSSLLEKGFSDKRDVYITNVVKCAPPQDKPKPEEYANCRAFLEAELDLLSEKKVILTLGKNAFEKVKAIYGKKGANTVGIKFIHGNSYDLGVNFPILKVCYHPSQRNIRNKNISKEKLITIFDEVLTLLAKN
ncbi:uracil-DNA glycosylase [Neobacillus sp. 19]|uniref:uracil-DNA glycosylase n=1 Tax=Neobacillus sp. 19 TaxID=3394458 RepID=UPI003BF68CC5